MAPRLLNPAKCLRDGPQAATSSVAVASSDARHYWHVRAGDPVVDATASAPTSDPLIVTVVEADALPRLHVDGLDFREESGKRWTMAGVTAFPVFQRDLDGADIEPFLVAATGDGANCLRVMASYDGGIGRFHPGDYGNRFDAGVRAFNDKCARHGIYVFWTVFADAQNVFPIVNDQRQFFARFCNLVRDKTNVLVELCNENFKNGVSAPNFDKPAGILSCSGSGGGGMDPTQPFWDWSDLHPERGDKWQLSTTTLYFAVNGYPGFPGTRQATVAGEPIGFSQNNEPGRRSNDPAAAYRLGVGCVYGAGGVAHSDSGIRGEIATGVERECIRAFLRGINNAVAPR